MFVIYGFLLAIFLAGSILVSLAIFQNFKGHKKMKDFIKGNQDRVKKFKEDGGIHSWVNMAIRMPNGRMENTHVCEHTGYVPAFEGFVPLESVKNTIRERKIAKEFEEFKKVKLNEIAGRYDIQQSQEIEEIYKEIIGLKQAFHVQYIQKELGVNVKVVSNMEELDTALEEIKDGKS